MITLNIRHGQCVTFVDPGIGGTGLAQWWAWDTSGLPIAKPSATVVLRPSRGTWMERFRWLMVAFDEWLAKNPCEHVFIEGAALWTGSARSMASGASGNLVKLAMVIGGLLDAAQSSGHVTAPPKLLPVREWKGQLPKRVVRARVQRALGIGPRHPLLREHLADAVGMGVAAKGQL